MVKQLSETDYIVEKAPERLVNDFSKFFNESKGFIAGGAIRNYFESVYNPKPKHDATLILPTPDPQTVPMVAKKDDLFDELTKPTSQPFDYVVKDIDVFFHNINDFQVFVDEHYDPTDPVNGYSNAYSTSNSIGFPYGEIKYSRKTMDCVRRNFGTPYEIISNFDYSVTQAALFKSVESDLYETGEIYLIMHPDFKEHIKNKELVLAQTPSHRSIMERTYRYVGYGFIPTEDSSTRIIENFLTDYPELKNITVPQFVESFSDAKKVLSKFEYDKMYGKYSEKYELIPEGIISKDKPVSTALGHLIVRDLSLIEKSPDSLASHTSIERHFIRSAISAIEMPKDFEKNKSKLYKQTIKKLNLPSSLFFRANISYAIVNFHNFLINNYDLIGKNNVYSLVDFVHSQSVVTVDGERFFYCRVNCLHHNLEEDFELLQKSVDGIIEEIEEPENNKAFEHMQNYDSSYVASDDWTEIIHKAFLKNDSEECIKSTADFFVEFMTDKSNPKIPSLANFHEALDNDLFNPNIPGSLMTNLMIEEN